MLEWENMRTSFAEILALPAGELTPDTVLGECADWDSLAKVGMVALVFEKTGATVSQEEIAAAVTLQDILDLAALKMRKTA